ncbi:DNA mismatch repair protein MLH3 [Cryptococcus deuterogattii LA55]|nr:DNA mismatch repair protein MLH3 [Cryptococcus deuterogattii LA55]KIR95730.1 DNA mismatch repair protein MLH3 [Cryptococcus deuterogattii CBS 10090]
MPDILPLPRPTSTTLRSSIILPSLAQIFSELLQNSLDAGATKIECYVNMAKGSESLRVEDDGTGISKDGLAKVGKRFRTSKEIHEGGLGPVGSYGFRGEALASIASLSLLDITTRRASFPVYTKILKHSKTLFEGPNPDRHIAGGHGTTVVVREIFRTIPVRREELAATSSTLLMNQLKKVVETLALGNPGVRWVLWEERSTGTGGLKRIMGINASESALDVFKSLYGSALVQSVQKIRVTTGKKKVDGFISIFGDVSKAHQHLYINNYPIDRGDVHTAIARKFASSKFAKLASAGGHDEDEDYHPYEFLHRNGFGPANTLYSTSSPTKRPMPHVSQSVGHLTSALARPSPLPLYSLRSNTPAPRPLSLELPSKDSPKRVASPLYHDSPDSTKRRRLTSPEKAITPRISEKSTRKSKWIDDLLAKLNTGVFPLSSFTSRTTSHGYDSTGDDVASLTCCPHEPTNLVSLQSPFPFTTDVQISKSSLSEATVLGQVDQKFIAVVLHTTLNLTTLALIDQHAADERISVEKVLLELCEGFARDDLSVAELTKTQPMIILTQAETQILSQPGVLPLFKRWGIRLTVPSELSQGEYVQVKVDAVPLALLSRLGRKEGLEMTRLVRGYLPVVAEHTGEITNLVKNLEGKAMKGGEDGDTEGYGGHWGRVMRFMPREMLELANSKACRGAIMFEDRLSYDQCGRLVHQLSRTKFPFMCAHGRPSMVPLVILNEQHDKPVTKAYRKINWENLRNKIDEDNRDVENDDDE